MTRWPASTLGTGLKAMAGLRSANLNSHHGAHVVPSPAAWPTAWRFSSVRRPTEQLDQPAATSSAGFPVGDEGLP